VTGWWNNPYHPVNRCLRTAAHPKGGEYSRENGDEGLDDDLPGFLVDFHDIVVKRFRCV
jgi:hypothetical protein